MLVWPMESSPTKTANGKVGDKEGGKTKRTADKRTVQIA